MPTTGAPSLVPSDTPTEPPTATPSTTPSEAPMGWAFLATPVVWQARDEVLIKQSWMLTSNELVRKNAGNIVVQISSVIQLPTGEERMMVCFASNKQGTRWTHATGWVTLCTHMLKGQTLFSPIGHPEPTMDPDPRDGAPSRRRANPSTWSYT